MKSKELIEIFNKTRRTENISLTVEQIKELIKDLEILEILRYKAKHLYDEDKENEYIIIELNDEILNNDFEIIKEWLDDDR